MNLQSSYRNHLIEPSLGTRNQIAAHFCTLDCEIEADNPYNYVCGQVGNFLVSFTYNLRD